MVTVRIETDLEPSGEVELVTDPLHTDTASIQAQMDGDANQVDISISAKISDDHRWSEAYIEDTSIDKQTDKKIETFDITNVVRLRIVVTNVDDTRSADGFLLSIETS